jgi:hypothetical protein
MAAARADGTTSLREVVGEIDAWLDAAGLDALDPPAAHDLARPRAIEIGAALNRWSSLRVVRAKRETTRG